MNRRFPALALAGVMTLSMLSACGSPASPAEPTGSPALVETPAPTGTPTAEPAPTATLEPTDTPAPESTPAGDIDIPGQNPPESSAPTPAPVQTPAPTKAPDDAPTSTPVDMSDAVQAVWDRIESEIELPSFGDMDGEVLSALYGIDSADLVRYIGKIPLMNVQATEIFIAQVKEGSMDAVKAGIEKRQSDLAEQWSSYLPEQLELVENYKLVTNGDYVLFAISSEADQIETIFNDCTN